MAAPGKLDFGQRWNRVRTLQDHLFRSERGAECYWAYSTSSYIFKIRCQFSKAVSGLSASDAVVDLGQVVGFEGPSIGSDFNFSISIPSTVINGVVSFVLPRGSCFDAATVGTNIPTPNDEARIGVPLGMTS